MCHKVCKTLFQKCKGMFRQGVTPLINTETVAHGIVLLIPGTLVCLNEQWPEIWLADQQTLFSTKDLHAWTFLHKVGYNYWPVINLLWFWSKLTGFIKTIDCSCHMHRECLPRWFMSLHIFFSSNQCSSCLK